MSLDPLLSAPLVIQVHLLAAIAAFLIGVVQLVGPKGTLPHKTMGLIWLGLMALVAASAFFIQHPVEPGDPFWKRFSFIHGFILLTAWGIVSGSYYLVRGGPTTKKHSGPFIGMFIGALVIAGALAFLPGRIMHAIVFGG